MTRTQAVVATAEAMVRADGGPLASVRLNGETVFRGSRYGAVGIAHECHFNNLGFVEFVGYDGRATTDIDSLRY